VDLLAVGHNGERLWLASRDCASISNSAGPAGISTTLTSPGRLGVSFLADGLDEALGMTASDKPLRALWRP
jgi:hypothetical protein